MEYDNSLRVLALTGTPASGKSTVVGLLRDDGVPCVDTGELIRDEAVTRYGQSPTEDEVWETATAVRDEHGPAGPTQLAEDWIEDTAESGADVLCVSSVRSPEEVDWLSRNVGPTLTVEVWAPRSERMERYVDQNIEADNVTDHARVTELQNELLDRERREAPYPDADVRLQNTDAESLYLVSERLSTIVEVMS